MDGGLISRKGRVSLAKVTGRSGKFIFGPLDRDLRAQDEGMRRSNLERPSEIEWSGGFERAGRRRDVAGALLRGELRRRRPIQRYRGPFGLRSCAKAQAQHV